MKKMEIHENLKLENLFIDGEKEIWKQVNTIEGLEMFKDMYYVSNFGRIKSVGGKFGDRVMKQSNDKDGYLIVGLRTSDGKQKRIRVNRLVAFAFVSGYKDGLICNHLDERKKNNHYSNLEWCTVAENNVHGTRTKRAAEKLAMAVVGTCVKTGNVIKFDSTRDASRCGFHSGSVSNACRGEYNPNGKLGGTNIYRGYRWSYVESA